MSLKNQSLTSSIPEKIYADVTVVGAPVIKLTSGTEGAEISNREAKSFSARNK
jgi:hypothetical protein